MNGKSHHLLILGYGGVEAPGGEGEDDAGAGAHPSVSVLFLGRI